MSIFLVLSKLDNALNSWSINHDFQQVGQSQNFTIWNRSSPTLTIQEKSYLDSKGIDRAFESCYLTKTAQDEHRNELVRLLFEKISGDQYRSTITQNLNIDCYETLLLGARDYCARPIRKVLDFGCGPGTITSSPSHKDFEHLLGFDFVEKSRLLAEEVGLKTLNEEELTSTPPESFDLILSCYVLHYESLPTATLFMLVELLAIGGVWAANFHKSKGLSWFKESLPRNYILEIKSHNSRFGDLMFIRKVSRI